MSLESVNKTISMNSQLTFVHMEEKKIRVFQSYMNLFKSFNTSLVFYSFAACSLFHPVIL